MDGDLRSLTREQLIAEALRLRAGIRKHRDSTGHDLCWHHPELWGLLPETSDPQPTVPDWPQFLRGCIRYRQSLDEQLPATRRSAAEFDRRVQVFRSLHESGCFVIPNPWDVGSARVLENLGFAAVATTSSGFAWSLGRRDNGITLEEALTHFRSIAASVGVPVNADFEGGFAVAPEEVASNVANATSTGVAGLSIEDSTGDSAHPLFDFALSVDRIRAARQAIDASGSGVLLTARSEGFIAGRPDLAETIRRLTAYADAGADCLYAPGIRAKEDILSVVNAVSPKPVNVLVGSDFTRVSELAAFGVRRISVGGALARVAWAGFLEAAREIAERGTFTSFAGAVSFADLNSLFRTG
jgi:2-methylisocitrate lyase-like PEP mutase family enzyme